jgi:hypothetical protein
MCDKHKKGISGNPLVEILSVAFVQEHVTKLIFTFAIAFPTRMIRTA